MPFSGISHSVKDLLLPNRVLTLVSRSPSRELSPVTRWGHLAKVLPVEVKGRLIFSLGSFFPSPFSMCLYKIPGYQCPLLFNCSHTCVVSSWWSISVARVLSLHLTRLFRMASTLCSGKLASFPFCWSGFAVCSRMCLQSECAWGHTPQFPVRLLGLPDNYHIPDDVYKLWKWILSPKMYF